MTVKASLTNALLQELVKTYERHEREKRKDDLDYYFKIKSDDGTDESKVG